MNFVIGVFDLFAYTIPGALYVAFFGYLGTKLHILTAASIGGVPTVVMVIVIVVLSFLLGYLAYPLGDAMERIVPRRRQRIPAEEFLRRMPAAQDRPYLKESPHLLLCALQLHDKDVAVDVTRLRASGLMVRNCAPPLLFGAIAAIVEIFAGKHPFVASAVAVLLLAASFTLVSQGRKLGLWAGMKTLELCFWLPEIDEKLATGES
ncbi:hypothetical protein [Amycolatopsis regifaucium]|uniref:Uncharacterized protein n=1 Tax=Amycolatopsis regifaucium TaxID=546365 RepID=A0A154M681_9PSEU|nr:hypothetical protein [Amycolatopsis regifaucium]KZB80092.1 hypothetical protein AVL48_13760 [Amycolatopsis regifaucium]OKA09538.1 hypothetical protein ATP06_0208790 [Amycolatopsis regifaucium]SFH64552.1 hypothetical protein SAMN04489731_105373 [Amycolatopsis regifaucium]